MADWFEEEEKLAREAEQNKKSTLDNILSEFKIDSNENEEEIPEDKDIYLSQG